MSYVLKPPFEIYNGGSDIADKEGHLCTAESPEIAEAILAALEMAALVRPSLTVPSQTRGTP